MKRKVNIMEVGPRDGFQNVREFIPTKIKLDIIRGLMDSGIRRIQISSFVSPRAIPQMQDAETVVRTILEEYPEREVSVLVPNFKGAQKAAALGIREICPVISLSASHNMANVKRTHEQSYEEIAKIRESFPDVKLTVDVATAFGCPFEGRMETENLLKMLGKLWETGIHAFTLCDTIGIAYPAQVENVIHTVRREYPEAELNVHIHDTRNMGILNSYVAIKTGIDAVQTALGGLGGCPFAPGATGNTATEDLAYMLIQEGYDIGIDFQKLLSTARMLREKVNGNYSGHQITIDPNPCYVAQE
ncbi:MAG: hydroxymethylglutaryl-CoA lyase [Lachnospiraceae bacterium]|nr:hydroxymethylglutaryl-CoA lyase [Lachnospiraceae bacterium]